MKRPFVTLNMASSIDGKITTRTREPFALGSDEDRALMQELRSQADAVLIGRGTLYDEDPSLLVTKPELLAKRRVAHGSEQPAAVVVSASLDFPIDDSRFFTASRNRKIVFTTAAADFSRISRLEHYAEVVIVPANQQGSVDLAAMAASLGDYGISRLLLEGGGVLNFAMLEAGLIDEIYLTLCPLIIGGADSPTTFEGRGFTKDTMRRLRLDSVRVNSAGEIFLHYFCII